MSEIEEKVEKSRYWLKLDKDFLKSPHIKVIKSMPNGKDYVLFYLSLMLESVESVGHLKFTDLIPYNDEMLSALTDTNIDVVRNAVKVFEQLGLLEKLDDGTIFLSQVSKMTGKRSESADRVAKHRALKKAEYEKMLLVTNCNDNIDIQSIENKKENIENKKEKPIPNNKPDLKTQILNQYNFSENVVETINSWLDYKKEIKSPYKETGLKTLIKKIDDNCKLYGNTAVIDMINESIANQYKGITWDKLKPKQNSYNKFDQRHKVPDYGNAPKEELKSL